MPPYLEKEKSGDEMARVLFQYSHVSGIMTSDAFVEKRVSDYFRTNPAHAAQ